MESKIDRADFEGNFATPDIFARDGVTSRMDAKFPFHPLEKSEAKYKSNIDQSEMMMLRRTMGIAMPLKLAMEKKAVSKVGHLPCLSVSSKASLEALTGEDFNIGFDDVFGKFENFESMTESPFNVVNKYLDDNKI